MVVTEEMVVTVEAAAEEDHSHATSAENLVTWHVTAVEVVVVAAVTVVVIVAVTVAVVAVIMVVEEVMVVAAAVGAEVHHHAGVDPHLTVAPEVEVPGIKLLINFHYLYLIFAVQVGEVNLNLASLNTICSHIS